MSSLQPGAPVRAPMHLAVALDGTGPFDARYWADLVRTAERGHLDLVTIEDATDARPAAAFAAALTGRIGLAPAVTATGAEPFPIASALAALDEDARGRAAWWVRTSEPAAGPAVSGLPLGPRARADAAARRDAAAVVVEDVRRLWDAWSAAPATPAAVPGQTGLVRPVPRTGPELPLGAPLVVTSGDGWDAFRFAARVADVLCVAPADAFGASALVDLVRAAERDVARGGPPLRILADTPVDGTASELADRLLDLRPAGLDGFRLRPADPVTDLTLICDGLVPELRRRGAFRPADAGTGLRARFGLDDPAGRYTGTAAALATASTRPRAPQAVGSPA